MTAISKVPNPLVNGLSKFYSKLFLDKSPVSDQKSLLLSTSNKENSDLSNSNISTIPSFYEVGQGDNADYDMGISTKDLAALVERMFIRANSREINNLFFKYSEEKNRGGRYVI